MLKMVIADDEQIIRESISCLIDWKSLDIEIVGCCKNGVEALDTIMDEYPDIVLTDIKMPGLSGLGLIEKIRQIDSNIEFIILSGYKEFEFAKQAMQFGVKHYLLKPISEDQIIEAIQKAKLDCYSKQALHQLAKGQERFHTQMEQSNKKLFVIEKVKTYLEEHLSSPNLSLKYIAENVLYMNVDYLSRQFISETGEKFSVFLTRMRMEAAKALLLRCDSDTIYSVAEQVGCGHNPRYFSQIFKKYTGMTPSDYIDHAKNIATQPPHSF